MSKVNARKKLAKERLEKIGIEKIRSVLLEYHGMNAKDQKVDRYKFIKEQADKEGLAYQAYKHVLTAYRENYGKIRVCTKCKNEITQENECTNNSYCKRCWAEMSKARREDRKANIKKKAKVKGAVDTKICQGCDRNLSLLKYPYNNAAFCNSCTMKNFRHNKPITQREINQAKAASIMAPRIAKTKSDKIIARNWRGRALKYEDLFKICESECWFCEEKLELWQIIEVDHIIPLESGGLHNRFNIAPIHQSCNQFKGAFNILDAELGPEYKDRAEQARKSIKKYYQTERGK